MPVTATSCALAAGTPLSITDRAVAAGTHTDAVEPTGTWTVRAKLAPTRSRPSSPVQAAWSRKPTRG